MLRLAAGSCSREIRPLLLAFQLHFTALHICCESYFSAFSPEANTALLWLHWLSLTAQPLSSFFIHNKFRLSSSLASLYTVFVIYLFGLFSSERAETGQMTETQQRERKRRVNHGQNDTQCKGGRQSSREKHCHNVVLCSFRVVSAIQSSVVTDSLGGLFSAGASQPEKWQLMLSTVKNVKWCIYIYINYTLIWMPVQSISNIHSHTCFAYPANND